MSRPATSARCSHGPPVPLTARALCRLALTLEAPPGELCGKVLADRGSPDAFALDEGGARWRLTLRQRNARGCAFLLTLPAGASLCGLGPLAPRACGHDARQTRRPAADDERHHAALVSRWNALVARRGGRYLLETFADYLLNGCAEAPR